MREDARVVCIFDFVSSEALQERWSDGGEIFLPLLGLRRPVDYAVEDGRGHERALGRGVSMSIDSLLGLACVP